MDYGKEKNNSKTWQCSGSCKERFEYIVNELVNYAQTRGIKLEANENIKDVVTFGYLNTLPRLNAKFGDFNEKIIK